MPPPSSPLADTVASLRVATLATQAHACVPAAIHALILACLARIFGRLEDMIRAWQAGLLPLPSQRPRSVRNRIPGLAPDSHSARSTPPRFSRRRRAPHAVSRETTRVVMRKCAPPAPRPKSGHPTSTAARASRRHPTPTPTPTSTAARRRIKLIYASPKHAHFITKTKQIA